MKTIYRFKLNRQVNKIEVMEITNYETKVDIYGDTYFRYRSFTGSCYNYVREKNLDKMKNNQVYTFNPDIAHARDIIIEALNYKIETLKKDIDHIETTLYAL